MKKLFLFLILGIALVSFGGCDPINPPEVVKYTITATYDFNVTISPASVVVEKGDSAILNVITKTGYKSTVKVNGKVVSLTSSKLILSNVVADMKVEATSSLKQFTLTAKSYGNGTITPEVAVVDSGKSATFTITPYPGYLVDVFKVNNTAVSLTSNVYTNPSVSSGDKLEVTFKERVKYTVTASISYIGFFNSGDGGGTIYNTTAYGQHLGGPISATAVVDSGSNVTFVVLPEGELYNASISSSFQVTPMSGLKIKEFNVDGAVITSAPCEFNVGGKSVTYQTYTISNITSDKKVEIKLKAIAGLSSEFYGVRWVCDSTYITDLKDIVWVYYDLPHQHSLTFLENGTYYEYWGDFPSTDYGVAGSKWSIDKKTNPWTLMLSVVKWNIELFNDKKLVISSLTFTSGDAKFTRKVYIPLPE